MRNFFGTIAAVVVAGVLSLAAPLAAGASGYVNQADIDVFEKLDTQIGAFWDEVNSSSATLTTVTVEASALKTAFQNVANHSFSTKINSDYSSAANKLKTSAGKGVEVTEALIQGLRSEDVATRQSAVETFQADIDKVTSDISTANQEMSAAVDASNNQSGTVYLVITVIAAVISLGSFIWAFRSTEPTQELTKARRTVAYGSLWILGGAAVTYASFIFADYLGGSYYIMYGPVLVGGALFVSSITGYVKLKRDFGKGAPSATPPASPVA